MTKYVNQILIAILIIGGIVALLLNSFEFVVAIRTTIIMWAEKIFPSLFPFFVLSLLLLRLGIAYILGEVLGPIMQILYKTSKLSGFVLVMGLISGNPNGAKIIGELVQDRMITKQEGQFLLNHATFMNPMFVIGTIGVIYFGNIALGIAILLSHIISNIILGISLSFLNAGNRTFSLPNPINAIKSMVQYRTKNPKTLGETVTSAIQDSINTCLLIGGYMILFTIIIQLFNFLNVFSKLKFFLYPILRVFSINENMLEPIFISVLEIANGIEAISTVPGISPLSLTIFLSFILSFASFSIHMQVYALTHHVNLSYASFLISRLAHAFLSIAISFPIYYIFKNKINNSSTSNPVFSAITFYDKQSVLFSVFFLLLYIILINTAYQKLNYKEKPPVNLQAISEQKL